MTDTLEDELRRLFIEDAESAPRPHALADVASDLANRNRRMTRVRIATGVVAASFLGIVVAATVTHSSSRSTDAAGSLDTPPPAQPAGSPATQPGHQPTGALPDTGDGAAACPRYSPELIAGRHAFAFDGTVTAIGATHTAADPPLQLASTTFRVHHWYTGGTSDTATVKIPVGWSEDPLPPPYGVGTRLLVSGYRGAAAGQGLVAWGCGYTRYFDPATASSWAAAIH
jgi:hypothetical protein